MSFGISCRSGQLYLIALRLGQYLDHVFQRIGITYLTYLLSSFVYVSASNSARLPSAIWSINTKHHTALSTLGIMRNWLARQQITAGCVLMDGHLA